jgi:phospholipase/carboxylesterase
MQTFEIDANETAQGSVIWLHGLGAGPHDFEDVVPLLEAPQFRFVFPAAPERPVTINGGMKMPAWYDILSLADPPLRERESDVRESEQELRRLIEREHERGIPYEHIVLCGFSQGGAMALHTGLRFEQRLAGVLVLSGYLVLPNQFDTERQPANQNTPFVFFHGTHDPMVPPVLGRSAHARLQQAGYSSQLKTYPMPHTLCLDEVAEIRQFLSGVLPR